LWNSFIMSHFSIFRHEYIVLRPRSPSSHTFLVSFPFSLLPTSSVFKKKKKRHFFFQRGIQGVSLWHFRVCMYYNLNWSVPSVFCLSILVLFFITSLGE
jgi:hypothetical protein